jgi:ATP-dependent DNA helicase RecQ
LAADVDLRAALRRYWGYENFRPRQERIVRSLLAGHDAAVVMPTGGGKSLCYQLPAVVSGRTAIVISPLIALMQDQVAQLTEMGIPAAVLNSTVPWPEQTVIRTRAAQGAYRLLYLSPERLAMLGTVAWLERVPIGFFAIDEAHCISEWGHEFRPEYSQLGSIRTNFPDKPIAAFTASATRRVRHDILAQLQLRDPDKYIVSFYRPNLRYLVKRCEDAKMQSKLLLDALRAHANESVIVYVPTVARVEEVVGFLGENGIRAVPYHGQMDTQPRRRNQERWMGDETRVLVGTLAFGLGINKANVRAVIHLALPRSVEQYYQEAGRAGRDGAPADCLLLWQKKDMGLLAHFIQAMTDRSEQERSWERYREVRDYAESQTCRQRTICQHFGELPKWETCGACDVCLDPPAWFRGRDGVLEVPGRALLDSMSTWRAELAARRSITASVLLSDDDLEDLCRRRPRSYEELLEVSGIGEKKAEAFGDEILEAIAAFENESKKRAAAAESSPGRRG